MNEIELRKISVPVTLESILHPYQIETFFSRIWNREVAVLDSGTIVQIADPVAWFVGLLDMPGVQYPSVRLSGVNGDVDPLQFTYSTGRRLDWSIKTRNIWQLMRAGATLRISGVSDLDPVVKGACEALAMLLGCKVEANGYLCIDGSEGTAAHFDSHHVLAQQLAGTKLWEVGSIVFRNPTSEHHDYPTKEPSLNNKLITASGSTLYLPPGMWHRANGRGLSLHLTFGIKPPNWAEWLQGAARSASNRHSILRAALPMQVVSGACVYRQPSADEVTHALRLVSLPESTGDTDRQQFALNVSVKQGVQREVRSNASVRSELSLVANCIWSSARHPISLYVRGSFLRSNLNHLPWDIDLILLSSTVDQVLNEADAERIRHIYGSRFPTLPSLDLTVAHIDQLISDPKCALKLYLLKHEAALVMGSPAQGFNLELTPQFAAQLFARSLEIAESKLSELVQTSRSDSDAQVDPLVARRAAKAVLRTVGASNVSRIGRLVRDPESCVRQMVDWPEDVRREGERLLLAVGGKSSTDEVVAASRILLAHLRSKTAEQRIEQ